MSIPLVGNVVNVVKFIDIRFRVNYIMGRGKYYMAISSFRQFQIAIFEKATSDSNKFIFDKSKLFAILDSKSWIDDFYFAYHDKDKKEDGSAKDLHCHIFIKCNISEKSSVIENLFGVENNQINKIDGKFYKAIQYLVHHSKIDSDKYQYESDIVVSKKDDYKKRLEDIDNDCYEGAPKSKKKKKIDVSDCESPMDYCYRMQEEEQGNFIDKNIVAQLCHWDNETNLNCYNDFLMQFPTCKNAVQQSYGMYLQKLCIERKNQRNMKIYWFSGKSGSNKTTYAKIWAYKHYPSTEVFISSGTNDILDSYNGERCIIFDEFRGSEMSYNDLLKLLDLNTSAKAKSRYFNKCMIRCETLIITSVKKPNEVYNKMFENDKDRKIDSEVQLYRRCSNLWMFRADFIQGKEIHEIDRVVKFKYNQKRNQYEAISAFEDITAELNEYKKCHVEDEPPTTQPKCSMTLDEFMQYDSSSDIEHDAFDMKLRKEADTKARLESVVPTTYIAPEQVDEDENALEIIERMREQRDEQ